MRSRSSSVQTECSCNHMTHFAVLFDYGDNLEVKIKAVNLYIEFFWSQYSSVLLFEFELEFRDRVTNLCPN